MLGPYIVGKRKAESGKRKTETGKRKTETVRQRHNLGIKALLFPRLCAALEGLQRTGRSSRVVDRSLISSGFIKEESLSVPQK